jgi:TniQ
MLWPARRKPLSDELLSSWYVRLARANGLFPINLWKVIQPQRTFSLSILDSHNDTELFNILARHTRLDAAIFTGMLAHQSSLSESSQFTYRRARDQILRFCPVCLFADGEPYYRRSWQFARRHMCPKHHAWLQVHCRHCSSPINLQDLSLDCVSLAVCFGCRGDLGRQFEQSEENGERIHFCDRQGRLEAIQLNWE